MTQPSKTQARTRWRVGTKQPINLYRHIDGDECGEYVGVAYGTPGLSTRIVAILNGNTVDPVHDIRYAHSAPTNIREYQPGDLTGRQVAVIFGDVRLTVEIVEALNWLAEQEA